MTLHGNLLKAMRPHSVELGNIKSGASVDGDCRYNTSTTLCLYDLSTPESLITNGIYMLTIINMLTLKNRYIPELAFCLGIKNKGDQTGTYLIIYHFNITRDLVFYT